MLLLDISLCSFSVIHHSACRIVLLYSFFCFFFQAEDGIRDAQESRGLGDVYKRQRQAAAHQLPCDMSAHRPDRTEGEIDHTGGPVQDLSLIHI